MRKLLILLVLLPISVAATDLNQETSAAEITVENTGLTEIRCPLSKANWIQVLIQPSSTAQIYTIQNTNGTQIEVPSGSTYELGPLRKELDFNQVLFSVQTASSSVTLQVIAQRVQ